MIQQESFLKDLKKKIAFLEVASSDYSKIEKLANSFNFWEIANFLGVLINKSEIAPETVAACKELINEIRTFQGEKALNNTSGTKVVLGTSGWRGVIGEDFTLLNVHKVLRAIIELLKSKEYIKENDFASFADVQKAGILILRDNRFLGDTFLQAARKELTTAGIKVYDAGECPTGVGSAVLAELKAAGSINFTPSHNPMEYAGIKFNPRDGGPADEDLTSVIENHANNYMTKSQIFTPAGKENVNLVEKVDAAGIFTMYVERKSKVFDIRSLRRWLQVNSNRISLVIDFMHGSSRGYIQEVLGRETIASLEKDNAITLIDADDDYSFHGVKPEPSSKNQKLLMEILKNKKRRFNLAVALDPDADRIRFADAEMDIDMNRFAAIAYSNLLNKGTKGGIVTSVPSSGFALKIARENEMDITETKVGFKNFRSSLKDPLTLLAYEESDGISFRKHTLEKCAIAGFLAAIDCMASREKNLSKLYAELQQKYGYFYPEKAGAEVKGVSVKAWQDYKKAVGKVLLDGMFKEGDFITIGKAQKCIAHINTLDGLKLVFDDDSWVLLRPSGTEPKFRYYYEVVSSTPLDDPNKVLDEYRLAAENILKRARSVVDSGQ